MKKILFTDLDGTLLNDQSQIDAEMKQALQSMSLQGHPLVLSSGRPLESILEVKRFAQIPSENTYIIANNGSILYDCTKQTIFHEVRLTLALVQEIWKLAKEHQLHIQTYTDKEIVTEKDNEEIRYYQKRIHLPLLLTDDPGKVLQTPPHKMLMIHLTDHEKLADFQTLLQTRYADEIQTVFSNPRYLEIFSKQAGKGNALRYLCHFLNIPVENSYAAGDAQNDLSMLQAAGHSIAMKNAEESLLQQADIITRRSNNECGLADMIYEYIL